jgi:hypothetical protein
MSCIKVVLRVKIKDKEHLEELKRLASEGDYKETGVVNNFFFIRLTLNDNKQQESIL